MTTLPDETGTPARHRTELSDADAFFFSWTGSRCIRSGPLPDEDGTTTCSSKVPPVVEPGPANPRMTSGDRAPARRPEVESPSPWLRSCARFRRWIDDVRGQDGQPCSKTSFERRPGASPPDRRRTHGAPANGGSGRSAVRRRTYGRPRTLIQASARGHPGQREPARTPGEGAGTRVSSRRSVTAREQLRWRGHRVGSRGERPRSVTQIA